MNLQQHWLPLRRFAASPDRWYNLNSLLNGPEWLSKIYLGMALNEAEQGGHSVFVVRKIGVKTGDETGLSVLPECQADLMGLQFGSPSSGGRGFSNGEFHRLVLFRRLGPGPEVCFGCLGLRRSHVISTTLSERIREIPAGANAGLSRTARQQFAKPILWHC